MIPFKGSNLLTKGNSHGCLSQRFLKFPDFFLTNVKFP